MGLLNGYDAIAKAQDEFFDEVKNKWNDSVQKWRGISWEDYFNIETRADIVDLFAVGAEVFFMQNDAVQSGKIDKIEIYMHDGKHKVWYHIDSVKERLDSCWGLLYFGNLLSMYLLQFLLLHCNYHGYHILYYRFLQ